MKNSYKINNDYYQNTSRQFNASTRSMTEKRHNLSSSKVSESKSKFQHRIEKACPNNSAEAYKKQVTLLKKQLQRLQKENLKKDHRIFQMESTYTMYRQLETELQETYRIIYMYEGKIQELQRQLKRLQTKVSNKIQSNFTPGEIEDLLNEYQDDNSEMSSTIEGQNRIIMELEEKLRTIQSKYFHTSWKLSSQNRVLANPLKKKFPKLRDTIVIQEVTLAEREKMMNDLENKYQGLTAQKAKNYTKSSVFSSRQKLSVNNSENRQVKDGRYIGAWETPKIQRLSKNIAPQQQEGGSQNYTVQKIQSSQRVSGIQYRQEWQANKQANKIPYESYKANEDRKNRYSSGQNQSMSLNYLSSQMQTVIQKSVSPQNGIPPAYRLQSSSQRSNVVSQNFNNQRSQDRILSPQTIYRSAQTNVSRLSLYQRGENPQSPSSRIIRVSRDKQEPSSSQNNDSIKTTYYQGPSMGSQNRETTDKKVRYVMRQAS